MLKAVAGRYLPKPLLSRPKQGFSFPLGSLDAHGATRVSDDVWPSVPDSSSTAYFDAEYVRRITNEHLSGRADHNYRLWILINLEFWYRSFIDGESLESQREHIQRSRAMSRS